MIQYSMSGGKSLTLVITLVLAISGLAVVGWLSSKPDKPGGMSPLARVLSALVHVPAWAFVIGGFSGGVALILGAITLPSLLVGLLGLLLIGATAGLCAMIRNWLRF